MHDSHVRNLEDKAARKKGLLERSEGMCELAVAHLKKKKEQEILRVQIELEKQTMRAGNSHSPPLTAALAPSTHCCPCSLDAIATPILHCCCKHSVP